MNAKSNDVGWTPLILASMYGHQSVVVTLLQAGADVHAKDNNGGTPLSWATFNKRQSFFDSGHQERVDLFLKMNGISYC